MPFETGIDETCGGMGEDTQTAERALAFQTGGDGWVELHILPCGGEREFAGVQDPRLVGLDFELFGQRTLVFSRVDIGVGVVVEQAEETIQTHVDGSGLHHLGRPRVEGDMTVGLCGEDVTVGQQHEILLGKYDALIAAAGLRVRPRIHCMPVYAAARPSVVGSAHALSQLQHSLGSILSGKHRVAHSIASSHRTCQQTADQEHQFPIIQPLFLLLSPFSPPRWHPPPGFLFRMWEIVLIGRVSPLPTHTPLARGLLPTSNADI